MYCRNCGVEVPQDATVCMQCGAPPFVGRHYCPNCGHETNELAVVCVHCGIALGEPAAGPNSNAGYAAPPPPPGAVIPKSRTAAGLLGIFLGCFGAHNFYLGFNTKAVIQLLLTLIGSFLTCGISAAVSAIWGFVEGILILTNSVNTDAYGQPLRD